MAEVASVFQTKRIGVETTSGTAVQADTLLQSVGFTATVTPTIEEFTPEGSKVTAMTIYVRDMTDVSMTGKPTYDELTYILAMLFGEPTVTNPSGAAYVRNYAMNSRSADPFKTFTLDFGYDQYWYRASSMFLRDFTFTISTDSVDVEGSGMAQNLSMNYSASSASAMYKLDLTGASGGTFTVTKGAGTTSALNYNVSASALQTALEGLTTIGAGNVIVTKANAVYTISFINSLADQAVTITVDTALITGTIPAPALTSLQTGTTLTTIPLKPIMVTHADIYLEDSYAALAAATPIARGFNYEFSISNKMDVVRPIRSTVTSFDGVVETKPDVDITLSMSADGLGRAMLTTMRNSGKKYLRVKCTGETITGNEKYTLQIDQAVQIMELSGPEDQNGIFALNWTFRAVEDSNLPGGFKITLENTVATL